MAKLAEIGQIFNIRIIDTQKNCNKMLQNCAKPKVFVTIDMQKMQ